MPSEIRYRRNPIPRKMALGRRMLDVYHGWSYEKLLQPDLQGHMTDPRRADRPFNRDDANQTTRR